MAESILQTYLNNQFIKTAEQENITKLKAAATEVKKRLSKKKAKVIPYTLVALDPFISEDEPIVADVEKIIITKWSTFKNSVSQTKDKPVNYIRAVILEALNDLASDEHFATIIWLSGRNIISHYKLANESVVVEEFLKSIGNKVEISSRSYWGIKDVKEANTPHNVKIDSSVVSSAKINEASLAEQLQIASQYSGWSQYGGGGTNPSSLNNQNWAPHFSTNAAKGIATEVNKGFTAQNKSLNAIAESIQKELENYFLSIQPYYEQLSTNLTQGIVANNKRSELLWWKEALLSTSQNKSYRSLDPIGVAITMAYDLSCFVDPIYPVSVDFFLKETLRCVLGDDIDSNKSLADLFKSTSELDLGIKNTLLSLMDDRIGRKSLGIVVANMLNEESEVNPFDEIGIDNKIEVSLADFTVWLFNDLQANKIAIAK
ncbi:GTPase-associated system all-helical protein GASH [Oceanihabitans sp. 2_MG-2023]|uniref:GTPase-associated system all-helical protein GASH n=1 Tax=Oceanihabitans sp. 2_MG-2023 TaxID=3062661 RepID=UPI0026E43E83|nr:GTPase-associated system all-helical protein GASH [Oceanihabitans sp. 2_MG-2023]MDO6596595.1 GTPase-associated system all-helical protein GASH [Oceanihabitans sp. 2_MG-2023]